MKKIALITAAAVALILIALFSIVSVDENEIVIAKPGFLFKEVKVLEPGTHFLFPFIYSKTEYSSEPTTLDLPNQIVFTSKFSWKRIVVGKLTYKIDTESAEKLARTGGDIEQYIIENLNSEAKKYFFPMDEITPSEFKNYSAALKEKLNMQLKRAGLAVTDYQIVAVRIDYGEEKLNQIARLKKQWEKKKRRLILIGMDALDLKIMQKLLDNGELPNFRKVLKNGTSGILKSMDPMLSPLIWTTIATGKYPDEHGILDFVQKDENGKLVPITSRMRKVPAVWNILSTLEIPVGFVAWWATWPAEEVDGFMVSERLEYQLFNLDIDTEQLKSSEGKIYPEEDFNDVQRMAKEFSAVAFKTVGRFIKISKNEWDTALKKGLDEAASSKIVMLKQLVTSTEAYHKVALELYKKYKPVLFSPYFEGTDVIGHLFMEFRPPKRNNISVKDFEAYKNAVPEYYRYIDQKLGEYIALVDDETDLMIVSDHGFKSGADRPYSSADIKAATAVEWHDMAGTIIFYGNSFKKGHVIKGASVIDVLPTVLAVLNLPAATNMPGKILRDAFVNPDFPEKIESYDAFVPTHGKTLDTTGAAYDEEIIKNLEALGYIDTGATDKADKGEATDDTLLSEINKAGSLVNRKKYKEAEKILLEAAEKKPKAAGVWAMLSNLYRETGEEDKQLDALMKTLDYSRSLSDIEYAIGSATKILVKRNRTERALGLVKLALKDHPESFSLHEVHARMLFLSKRYDEGIKTCETLLNMKPDDYTAMIMMAEGYFLKGNFEKADEVWNKAFRLKPDEKSRNLNYNLNSGNLNMRRKNFSAAVAAYKNAAKIKPDTYLTWYQLANAQAASGSFREARASMEKALSLAVNNKNRSRIYAGLARIYNSLGETSKEKEALRAGLAADPDNVYILRIMAFTHMQERNVSEAKLLFERMLKINPRDWDTMNRLGAIYIQEGNAAKGLELLKKSLQLNPNQPRLKQTLERLSK